MANSKLRCTFCKNRFRPEEVEGKRTPAGWFCSIDHAIEHSRAARERQNKKAIQSQAKKEKDNRRLLRERKQELRSRSWYLKECQKWFNKFIRLRDAHEPCISCGRHHQGQYHAGHYRTVASSPELRFEELNCHKQCAPCNNHLSGNIVNYRPSLIKKIGLDKVEWLEGPHKPIKITIDELKDLIAGYKSKCKELEKAVVK